MCLSWHVLDLQLEKQRPSNNNLKGHLYSLKTEIKIKSDNYHKKSNYT